MSSVASDTINSAETTPPTPPALTVKKCRQCKSIKLLNQFYHNYRLADEHDSMCKTCARRRQATVRAKDWRAKWRVEWKHWLVMRCPKTALASKFMIVSRRPNDDGDLWRTDILSPFPRYQSNSLSVVMRARLLRSLYSEQNE